MTWPVHAPCSAGVSEVVPTVAPAPLMGRDDQWAGGWVHFTSDFISAAQRHRECSIRPDEQFHSAGPVSLAHAPAQKPWTCRDREWRWRIARPAATTSDDITGGPNRATSDDAAGAGKSARAYFLTGKDIAAVGTRHQSTTPLDPLSARAVTDEPDQQPIAIESTDESGDLEDCVRRIVGNAPPLTEAQRGRLATLLRLHAAADQARQESRRYRGHVKLRQHPAAAVEAARTEEQHR